MALALGEGVDVVLAKVEVKKPPKPPRQPRQPRQPKQPKQPPEEALLTEMPAPQTPAPVVKSEGTPAPTIAWSTAGVALLFNGVDQSIDTGWAFTPGADAVRMQHRRPPEGGVPRPRRGPYSGHAPPPHNTTGFRLSRTSPHTANGAD